MSIKPDKAWEKSYGRWVLERGGQSGMPFLMPPELQNTVKAVLAAYPKAIPLLEKAATCADD